MKLGYMGWTVVTEISVMIGMTVSGYAGFKLLDNNWAGALCGLFAIAFLGGFYCCMQINRNNEREWEDAKKQREMRRIIEQ